MASSGPLKLSSQTPEPKPSRPDYYGMPIATEEGLVFESNANDERTAFQKVVNDMTFGLAYIRAKPVPPSSFIPVGMSLYLRQKGYHDLGHTIAWRAVWFILFLTLFGSQFQLYDKAILVYRMHFWCLIFSLIYFGLGILHLARKALDKSWITRCLQASYVLAVSFTMASSVFYIFLLFMDDINRKNPRKDNLYEVMADGYPMNTYLRTGNLDDPDTIIEFTLDTNINEHVFNPSRYQFVWFMHVACHIILPVVLMVPLYVENTRIYYADFIYTFIVTFFYTGLLWLGSQATYNKSSHTPCVGTTVPYCSDDRVNPEYKIIYWKLNFFQRGETASYILLYYFFVYVSFYVCRQVSKRYARGASLSYNLNTKAAPVASAIQGFNAIPEEQSSRGSRSSEANEHVIKTPVDKFVQSEFETDAK